MIENQEGSNEHLSKYIKGVEGTGEIRNNNETGDLGGSLGSTLDFTQLSVDELPCGEYYPDGTMIAVRGANIEELQYFSMMNENHFYDVFEKVTYLIEHCCFVIYPDGSKKAHTYIFDIDRWYLLFAIRELTFKGAEDLVVKNENGVSIPIKRNTFNFHKIASTKVLSKFNKLSKEFIFTPKRRDGSLLETVKVGPPTIGIQKCFTEFVIDEAKNKRKPNLAFIQIAPFLLPNRVYITQEGIKKLNSDFETMDKDMFLFLSDLITNTMKIGIKGVYLRDEAGVEAHADEIFPDGVKSIFVASDVVDSFLD